MSQTLTDSCHSGFARRKLRDAEKMDQIALNANAEHISTATLSKMSSCNAFASLLQRNAMASTSQPQVVPQEDSEDQQVLFPPDVAIGSELHWLCSSADHSEHISSSPVPSGHGSEQTDMLHCHSVRYVSRIAAAFRAPVRAVAIPLQMPPVSSAQTRR
jgi:hypothetical protein